MHKKLPNTFIFINNHKNILYLNNSKNIGVIYRNYEDPQRSKELYIIAKICRKKRYKLFVSNDVKLAIQSKADGIYIPAFNKKRSFLNIEKKDFIIIGSAHNQKEIHRKIQQKCKVIFLSPIFYMKNKKKLNNYKFNFLSRINNITFYALGGINEENFNKLRLLNIKGFGGIRVFQTKKPAYKRPVFLSF